MGMGSVVRQVQTDGTLKSAISKLYREQRTTPPLTPTSFMRASALGGMCPREEVLCSKLGVTRNESYTADRMMILAHGKALHYILQNEVLPAGEVLLGRWTCLDCAKSYGTQDNFPNGLVPHPRVCTCTSREFMYREMKFTDAGLRIGGHPDGFVRIPGVAGIGLLEAKSIAKGWEVRNSPDMGHVIQAHVYMFFTGLQWARILYWEKGAQGVDALIEHHVERDDETISLIKDVVKSVWDGVAGKSLPDRICANNACPRSKKCAVVKPCFDGLDPDGL